MTYIAMLIIVALAVGLFAVALTVYVRMKQVANGMLALGVKEFHEAADSLLKTSEELPDEVLDALSTMNLTAFAKGSHWRMRRLVVLDRKGLLRRDPQGRLDLAEKAGSMRPELQDLFGKASIAWLSIMCNRSLFVGALLMIEMSRLQVARGKISSQVANKEAIKVLPDLCVAA